MGSDDPNDVQLAVHGRRDIDAPAPVTTDDKWHIGSVTKSMTALLLAIQAEKGLVAFDDPITKFMPTHDRWRRTSLRDIMAHCSGLPANPALKYLSKPPSDRDLRRHIVEEALSNPPRSTKIGATKTRSTKTRYSNIGFMTLGRVIEIVAGKTWEQAVQHSIFEPLGLQSAGFGPPAPPNALAHSNRLGLMRKAKAPGTRADNPTFMGPAGRVHMSIGDFATYASHLLSLLRGNDGLVTCATYKDLIQPHPNAKTIQGKHGGGLIHTDAAKGKPARMWHNGSNTLWYAQMHIVPQRNRFAVVAANMGGLRADIATWRAACALTVT